MKKEEIIKMARGSWRCELDTKSSKEEKLLTIDENSASIQHIKDDEVLVDEQGLEMSWDSNIMIHGSDLYEVIKVTPETLWLRKTNDYEENLETNIFKRES